MKRRSPRSQFPIAIIGVSPLLLALVMMVTAELGPVTGRVWRVVTMAATLLAAAGLAAVVVDLAVTWTRSRMPGARWIEKHLALPPGAFFLLWFTNHSTRKADLSDLDETERALAWSSPMVKELVRNRVMVEDRAGRPGVRISRRTYRWLSHSQEWFDAASGGHFSPWATLSLGKTILYSTRSEILARQADLLKTLGKHDTH